MHLRASAAVVSAALVVLIGAAGCKGTDRAASPPTPPSAADESAPAHVIDGAIYVGRAQCARCHAAEAKSWEGSHHDLAMQEATPATVLGNFADASFSYAGTTTRFTTQGDRFVVRTDGPDGKLADYDVAYVFGVYPLQQYLIAFPDGRYQALSIVWDARPKVDGGQRWYHLYAGEKVIHTDVLHWTKFSQNWNAQCATCHSTNLRKGYDRASNSYKTTWSEIDVSCESCHGPASVHVAWADKRGSGGPSTASPAEMGLTASLRDRRNVQWSMQMATGIAQRAPAPTGRRSEVEVCAPCHARRAERFDAHVPGQPFLMSYRPTFLSEGLYRADGQMQDEVYNYGSFLQSRMYAAGVTCSDCHDPHSLKTRADGNALCAQCHLPSTFDAKAHHGHAPGSAGASCVACHMPTETYMGVDRRHDHGFRVPRPDQSERFDVPNTCTTCHAGKTPAWASAALDGWRTPRWRERPGFAETLARARQGRVESATALVGLASNTREPGVVRASAIELLPVAARGQVESTLDALAGDQDPLVRLAVAQGLQSLEPAARARVGGRLLDDPMRAVRIEAAAALVGEPASWLPAAQREALQRGIADVRSSEAFNSDRPESYVNLALLEERSGNAPAAIAEYEGAIRYAPWLVPAYVNLAELQRQTSEQAAEQTLRRGIAAVPDSAALLYALGLSLHRQQRGIEAVDLLRKAAQVEPESPRYPFAYALALDAQGRAPEALKVIDTALTRHPDDRDLLDAGLGVAQKAADVDRARQYVRRLLIVVPGDPALVQLARQLGVQ